MESPGWKEKVHDFGEKKEGEKAEHVFVYTGDRKYKKHTTSCGCTTGEWKDNSIKLTYVLGKVPLHLRDNGFMHTKKSAFIHFTDGHVDEVRLIGKIVI